MISVISIACRFIQLGIEQDKYVTPMKLQKLIYLAHGIHLARFNEPLIREEVEAWSYGPVIRAVYDTFKYWGTKPITEVPETQISDIDILTDDAEQAVLAAWEIGKNMTGMQLSNWSHSEGSPWDKTYKGFGKRKISRETISEYFRETLRIAHE